MKYLKLYEEFRLMFESQTSSEPVGIAVLGAPAGGKSFLTKKIADLTNDSKIKRALDPTGKRVDLTVDVLRGEFLSKDATEQLKGFVHAFYLMKQKAKDNESMFGGWFNDIKKLWSEKFSGLLPDLKVSVEGEELLFNGKKALENIDVLETIDTDGFLSKLDNYKDYKRVVRYFQDMKQGDAIDKKLDVSYDEAGDEPYKIISNIDKLHNSGYITDVFLIHPENVASNLIQNFYRVTTGGDGGRDSSGSIIQAFNDIEKSQKIYSDNAEKTVNVKSSELDNPKNPAANLLQQANTEDDKKMGDKPIDVFVKVAPMAPENAYKTFLDKLNGEIEGGRKVDADEQKAVFKSLLRYACFNINDIPEDAKSTLLKLTSDLTNEDALQVLKKASESGNYVFKFGGVTTELVSRAEKILK